jgi:hypothetical protein
VFQLAGRGICLRIEESGEADGTRLIQEGQDRIEGEGAAGSPARELKISSRPEEERGRKR